MQESQSWDLTDLFSSIEDEKIDELTNETFARVKKFQQKYRGNLLQYMIPTDFLSVLEEYEAILSAAVKPQAFGELIFTVDSISPANGAFLQKVRKVTTEIFSELIFFELEVGEFSDENFKLLLASEKLSGYKHYLEKLLIQKPFQLDESQEKIFQMKELTGRLAFARLFGQELSNQKFQIRVDDKNLELTQDQMLNLLYTSDKQETRAQAAKIFTAGLKQKENVLTFVTNTLAEDKKVSDELRGFSFPEQSRHLQNEAVSVAVEVMAEIVEKGYALVQEYYVFKKEILGLEKLYDYDRYAPLKISENKYSFAEAKEIVLDSFNDFDPSFGEMAKNFFEKKWIDALPKHGKRGGAYCEGATPDMHPYVFMNFDGSAHDVMTLAHELGHGINFELARLQTFVNYNSPLTLAETASIFAETLVFQKMISSITDKKVLLGLYMQKIESIFASVQRQISMYRFEQDLHNTYRAGGELPVSRINELWRLRQSQMYGDAVTLTFEYDSWWMYIPHFVNTPFYVYAYAFGELLALGLFEKSKQNPEDFFQKYKKFLEAGGSASPSDLADMFDMDLERGDFWESGMSLIAQYLHKAKQLHLEIQG